MDSATPKSRSWTFLFLLGLLLLNLGVLAFVANLALSKRALKTEPPEPAGLFSVAGRLQALPSKIKASMPGDVDVVKLSDSDFNCLLAAALGKDGLVDMRPDKMPVSNLAVRLKEGVFYVSFTKDLGFWTPFGRYVNSFARLSGEMKEDGSINVKLLRFNAGRLNVPPWLVQWWLDGKVSSLAEGQNGEELKRIVVSVKAAQGQLVVRYHPYELKKIIESKLSSPLLKGFWDML